MRQTIINSSLRANGVSEAISVGIASSPSAPRNDRFDFFSRAIWLPHFYLRLTGFSLIELLLSLSILGLGLCMLVRSFISSLEAISINQDYLAAVPIASEKLAELRLQAYQKKGLSASSDSGSVDMGAREASYKREVSEISEPEHLKEDLLLAKMEMTWQRRGKTRNYTMLTNLPKYKEDEE